MGAVEFNLTLTVLILTELTQNPQKCAVTSYKPKLQNLNYLHILIISHLNNSFQKNLQLHLTTSNQRRRKNEIKRTGNVG